MYEQNVFSGVVLTSIFLGEYFEYKVELAESRIVTVLSTEEVAEGSNVKIYISPEKVVITPQV
jgi:ABC-type Fe3+/spermidine/putrescine transport system ATPase subunit